MTDKEMEEIFKNKIPHGQPVLDGEIYTFDVDENRSIGVSYEHLGFSNKVGYIFHFFIYGKYINIPKVYANIFNAIQDITEEWKKYELTENEQIIKRLYEDGSFPLEWADKVKDALSKTEPKKLYAQTFNPPSCENRDVRCSCPICGHFIYHKSFHQDIYCEQCGQLLTDWDEVFNAYDGTKVVFPNDENGE
jgi:hypothetical protein